MKMRSILLALLILASIFTIAGCLGKTVETASKQDPQVKGFNDFKNESDNLKTAEQKKEAADIHVRAYLQNNEDSERQKAEALYRQAGLSNRDIEKRMRDIAGEIPQQK